MKFLVFIIITLLLVGCSYSYLNQIQVGMTKEAIIATVGTVGVPRMSKMMATGLVEVYEVGFFDMNYILVFHNGVLTEYAPVAAFQGPDFTIKIK